MSLTMVISMAVNSLYHIIDSYFAAKVSENAIITFYLGAEDQVQADR